jgi:diguanylate cyclase (GGDEF)-like protein
LVGLPRDESQQTAELRQAFLRHLPRRVETLRKKLLRLTRGAWDINALTLLISEVGALAGASGRYGMVGTSESLHRLELTLTPLKQSMALPDAATRAHIEQLVAEIGEAPEAPVRRVAVVTDLLRMPPEVPGGFPAFLPLPADYWTRFDDQERSPLQAGSASIGTEPPVVATVAAPATLSLQLTDAFELAIDLGEPASEPPKDFGDLSIPLPPDPPQIYRPAAVPPGTAETRVMPISELSAVPIYPDRAAPPRSEVTELAWPDSVPAPTPAPAPQPVRTPTPAPYVPPPAAPPLTLSAVPDSAPVRGPDPVPAVVESGPRRLYWLGAPSAAARDVAMRLKDAGIDVEGCRDLAALTALVQRQSPEAVLIDAAHQGDLEAVAGLLQRERVRQQVRIALLAFGDDADLSAKVKAMRSGVDLLLPATLEAAEAARRLVEHFELGSGAGFRVMIVEDDRSQALFAESVLKKAGVETLAVTEPLTTLEQLTRFKPDLILMDLYMPDISGMELTAIIREHDEFIATPIVFLSGEQDPDKHFEALSAGGDDFLSKPIRPKHLISAVTNRARRARAMRQRQLVSGETRDPLSGLHERAHVIDALAQILAEDERPTGALLFIELDGVAELRAEHGLARLEGMLSEVGAQLAARLQAGELAARYGDAALIVVLRRSTADAELLARQFRAQVQASRYQLGARSVGVSLSIGICPWLPQLQDPASLLGAAERAMSEARAKALDHISVYAPQAALQGVSEEEQIAQSLAEGLKRDTLQLLFQPIVSLAADGEEHYELMPRLRLDGGDPVSARQLTEVAQQRGLLHEIDRWLLQRALATIDERRRVGRVLHLYVRQSAASLEDHERVDWLAQQLKMRGLKPQYLTLEFNLYDVQRSLKQALGLWPKLRQLGVRLALDEFESSLTGLQLISALPADFIKLAPKYTRAPGLTELKGELQALIAAAHGSGRQVIAPMVENAQAAAVLLAAGVDHIQGNFIQQPGTELGFDFSQSVF